MWLVKVVLPEVCGSNLPTVIIALFGFYLSWWLRGNFTQEKLKLLLLLLLLGLFFFVAFCFSFISRAFVRHYF